MKLQEKLYVKYVMFERHDKRNNVGFNISDINNININDDFSSQMHFLLQEFCVSNVRKSGVSLLDFPNI